MKKIFVLVFALLSLAPLNALNLEDVLSDKTLAKEIRNTLQASLQQNNSTYTIAGLIYTGSARLTRTNGSDLFSLIQKEGYITYTLRANGTFNTFTLDIENGDGISNRDPHRTETYKIILKLYKDNNLIRTQLVGEIELQNAGIDDGGAFHTNLAVNALYAMGKFYVLDKEPNTCGQQYDISGKRTVVPPFETTVSVHHKPDCTDPNHCSCPRAISATRMPYFPAKTSFVIETEACKKNTNCRCPEYIVYEE